ncbi:MAG: hypothetical protein JWM52_649 [Candidatus Saccharibacteria bacterium]|nr:hypothetical protein [Candidatus Saccharibacteria bacterium]
MSKKVIEKKNRLLTLDYLRGFFIVVIIIDHFSRWPSILSFISGKALLWVTAAEGFVAISGLLVGYVRGYKNRDLPMKEVAMKLLRRAFLLYIWSVIASLIYTAIIWYVHFQGGAPGLPIEKGEWVELIYQTLTLKYTYLWVHYLTLYALFLAAAPIAIWLLRRNQAWLVILLSVIGLYVGYLTNNQALQWQVMFFVPSVAGFYLEPMTKWWKQLASKVRTSLTISVISLTVVTIGISILFSFYSYGFESFANFVNNTIFAKETLTPWRTLMAFLWFTGFALTFNLLGTYIGKWFGWLLLPFGTRSLTAYILHGVAICLISYFTLSGDNMIINSLLGIVCILVVWALIKIPAVQKIVPS